MSANVFIRSALSACTLAAAMAGGAPTALAQAAPQTLRIDLPSIPLHFESSIWAFRKALTDEGRAAQYTLALSARPAQ
ncbi:hypothetical protein DDE05_10910 [Streptomyces cavourensis]|jgi:hypothetical protein|uniref:hypothetical protein n=1 Tax=unclassified Achromobacter TaxID=2626865 RepID=UPI000DFEF688|nr:hypothetical protein DDE05_10910 [Streptomyces cavourensis]